MTEWACPHKAKNKRWWSAEETGQFQVFLRAKHTGRSQVFKTERFPVSHITVLKQNEELNLILRERLFDLK